MTSQPTGAGEPAWTIPARLHERSVRLLLAETEECEALADMVFTTVRGYGFGTDGGFDDEPDISHFEELEVSLEHLASALCDEFELPDSVIGADLDEVIVTIARRFDRLKPELTGLVEHIAELLDFLRSHSYGDRYTGDPPEGELSWAPLKQFIESFRGTERDG